MAASGHLKKRVWRAMSMSSKRTVPAARPAGDGDVDVCCILNAAVARWAAERHARVRVFIDANFTLAAALRLHRRAVGLDLLRAPGNVALVPIYLASQLAAGLLRSLGARRASRWLGTRQFFFETAVARELAWRLHTQLLELPYSDGARRSKRDALAEAVLTDPVLAACFERLDSTLLRRDADVRARLNAVIGTWTGARTGASELLNNLIFAGAGATAFQQLTPGALSLGPLIAAAIAQHTAILSFPLGATLGSLWYGVFTAAPSAALVVMITLALMLLGAVLTAFAGVISDPVQRVLGLHERRLHHLIDALSRQLTGDSDAALKVRDHYAARLFDLVDALGAAARLAP